MNEVYEGWYLAKKPGQIRALGGKRWSIVKVVGVTPFLRMVEVITNASGDWGWGHKKDAYVENPETWEFGPRINMPEVDDEPTTE